MNIGITCYPTVGGSGAVATELGKQLARRGHSIHFVSYRLPFRLGDYHENIRFHEVDVSSYSLFEHAPYDLALAAKMAEVSREHQLDLLHVHYAIPHAIAGILAQEMLGEHAPRLITTLHGTDITLVGQDRSFFEITRFGIERSDGVTAVSEFLKKMTVDEFQIQKPPIEMIPNFIDLATFSPARALKRSQSLAAPGEKVLLHTSNFRPVKRVLDVVRIMDRVNREVPSVLIMVGEGPERASAEALARRLGIRDRVRFLGRQDSAEELAGMADVFLLPSELESFGLAALEAMACGVPVIGSDAGGLPEVVKHTETGFLLPVGDVEGMAARTIEILKDEQKAHALGQAGRCRALSLFNADRVVTEYEKYYEKVLGVILDSFDVAAFCAHPDDAELAMGGALALESGRGRRVALVDLTRGECGSRGTPETREAEARAAAQILGAAHRESLGLPDAGLLPCPEHREAVVAAVRRLRPRVVLLQHWEQRHPDHAMASRLVYDGCFLAGLRNYRPDLGGAFRPQKLAYAVSMTETTEVPPSFVVDVSTVWETKMKAVGAFASQFTPAPGETVSLPFDRFRQAIELAGRRHGQRIGVEFGEGYVTREPLSVDDLLALGGRSL